MPVGEQIWDYIDYTAFSAESEAQIHGTRSTAQRGQVLNRRNLPIFLEDR